MLPREVYAPALMAPNLSWTLSPPSILAVGALGGAYVTRWRRVRGGPGARPADAPVWRLICFGGALLCVLIALVSPVDALAEQLFSMHMVQHVLLLDVAPILAILGLTRVLLRPLTRAVRALERRAGPLAQPAFAVLPLEEGGADGVGHAADVSEAGSRSRTRARPASPSRGGGREGPAPAAAGAL